MQQLIQAIYENGVLRPLEPLDLAEHELVSLAVERQNGTDQEPSEKDAWLDNEAVKHSSLIADQSITLTDVRLALSGIQGDLSDAVSQQRGEY
jgi:predicted DNA-binding antitoxin AbrB/MazE fold protein